MVNRRGGMRGVSGLCPAGYLWNGEFCEPELEFHPGEGPIGRHRIGMRPARRNSSPFQFDQDRYDRRMERIRLRREARLERIKARAAGPRRGLESLTIGLGVKSDDKCPPGYVWDGSTCVESGGFGGVAHANPGDRGCGGQARPNPGGCGCGGHAKMNGSDITPLATLTIAVGLGAMFYMMFNSEDP